MNLEEKKRTIEIFSFDSSTITHDRVPSVAVSSVLAFADRRSWITDKI